MDPLLMILLQAMQQQQPQTQSQSAANLTPQEQSLQGLGPAMQNRDALAELLYNQSPMQLTNYFQNQGLGPEQAFSLSAGRNQELEGLQEQELQRQFQASQQQQNISAQKELAGQEGAFKEREFTLQQQQIDYQKQQDRLKTMVELGGLGLSEEEIKTFLDFAESDGKGKLPTGLQASLQKAAARKFIVDQMNQKDQFGQPINRDPQQLRDMAKMIYGVDPFVAAKDAAGVATGGETTKPATTQPKGTPLQEEIKRLRTEQTAATKGEQAKRDALRQGRGEVRTASGLQGPSPSFQQDFTSQLLLDQAQRAIANGDNASVQQIEAMLIDKARKNPAEAQKVAFILNEIEKMKLGSYITPLSQFEK